MKIEKDKWVTIHYTLKSDDGNVIETSIGEEPIGYLHGNGYLIPALEKELEGKEPGVKIACRIEAANGYGEYNQELVQDVDRSFFETNQEIESGMQFSAMTPNGPMIFTVKEVGPEKIKIDGNHALAGQDLNFDVEIVDVRNATEEELNPHSCGGCCGDCGSDGCSGCGSGCH